MHFWNSKRVLITGHTGFKGSWLTTWLNLLGADVSGISLAAVDGQSLYSCMAPSLSIDSRELNLCEKDKLEKAMLELNPEIIFHLAAQPLVKESISNPLETYQTNVIGTLNLLNAIRVLESVKVIVVVTTDKVYSLSNREMACPLKETHPLGGLDPYSSSKAAVELLTKSFYETYLKNHHTSMATARAGNVIGGGDWAKNRLLPDAVRAWSKDEGLLVRMPYAIRPWQHVLDCLYGYLSFAEHLWSSTHTKFDTCNFGPELADCLTVDKVITLASVHWPLAKVHALTDKSPSIESETLILDNRKAKQLLGVAPIWNIYHAIDVTMNWYKGFLEGKSAFDLCLKDINSFMVDVSAQR